MKTFVHQGLRTTWTNTTGSTVTSGSVVVLRSGLNGKIGIAVADIASGATGELSVGPGLVHNLPKKVGDVFTHGGILYWDPSNTRLTTTFTAALTRAGTSDGVYASAATTANVAINT